MEELDSTPQQEPTYNDDDIKTLDWMEHIRRRPGMYIGKLGDGSYPDDGIYVLLKEVLDNSIDEYMMGYGRTIEVTIEAEKDTEIWVISPEVYQGLMEVSAPVANYTNELMASRFSEVMWLMEQVMWKSLDKRVAAFLLEEASIEGSSVLKITHEAIANHLGTHREVITRMLRYFQSEGMVRLSRGMVQLLDEEKLRRLQDGRP